nr:hypothetical protein [Tanacetum cinerariifolium]
AGARGRGAALRPRPRKARNRGRPPAGAGRPPARAGAALRRCPRDSRAGHHRARTTGRPARCGAGAGPRGRRRAAGWRGRRAQAIEAE